MIRDLGCHSPLLVQATRFLEPDLQSLRELKKLVDILVAC